jgi:ABC-type nickel/cobalt efflux system permease component RcnA
VKSYLPRLSYALITLVIVWALYRSVLAAYWSLRAERYLSFFGSFVVFHLLCFFGYWCILRALPPKSKPRPALRSKPDSYKRPPAKHAKERE